MCLALKGSAINSYLSLLIRNGRYFYKWSKTTRLLTAILAVGWICHIALRALESCQTLTLIEQHLTESIYLYPYEGHLIRLQSTHIDGQSVEQSHRPLEMSQTLINDIAYRSLEWNYLLSQTAIILITLSRVFLCVRTNKVSYYSCCRNIGSIPVEIYRVGLLELERDHKKRNQHKCCFSPPPKDPERVPRETTQQTIEGTYEPL